MTMEQLKHRLDVVEKALSLMSVRMSISELMISVLKDCAFPGGEFNTVNEKENNESSRS